MADEVTLTLPREPEFQRVAHLVLGGLAVRLNLTIENLEDMQIALDSLLEREDGGKPHAITVRVRVAGRDRPRRRQRARATARAGVDSRRGRSRRRLGPADDAGDTWLRAT